MGNVWHYTSWAVLPKIVASGVLQVGNVGAPDETPLLWFSANQQWEPIGAKLMVTPSGKKVALTFSQQQEKAGCVRFGLHSEDARLLDWKTACAFAGTPRAIRRALEIYGRKIGGNPAQWFATGTSIALSEFAFQVWDGKTWVNTTGVEDMVRVWAEVRESPAPGKESI